MTWGFYGSLVPLLLVFPTDKDRLFQQPWKQHRSEGVDDFSGHSKCRAKFFLVLPPTYCMYGLWCRQTKPGQDDVVRPHTCSVPFCFWSHICHCQLDDYPRKRRASGPSGHLTSSSHPNSLLHLDTKFLESYDERSVREETERQSYDV